MERLHAMVAAWRPITRFAAATLIIVASGIGMIAAQQLRGPVYIYLLFPAIFLVSCLFSRGTALYAIALSLAFVYVAATPPGRSIPPADALAAIAMFAIIALGVGVASESMRRAWEAAAAAERRKDLHFRELAHRTRNDLALVISVLLLQARDAPDPETKAALEDAAGRVQAVANAHKHLQTEDRRGLMNSRESLQELCRNLANALRGVRPISVNVDADEIFLPARQAIPLGLIANELVTNAFKHAYPDGRAGIVKVTFRKGPPLALIVEDNGVGSTAEPAKGTGSTLVQLLAGELGATLASEEIETGCRFRVTVPIS